MYDIQLYDKKINRHTASVKKMKIQLNFKKLTQRIIKNTGKNIKKTTIQNKKQNKTTTSLQTIKYNLIPPPPLVKSYGKSDNLT